MITCKPMTFSSEPIVAAEASDRGSQNFHPSLSVCEKLRSGFRSSMLHQTKNMSGRFGMLKSLADRKLSARHFAFMRAVVEGVDNAAVTSPTSVLQVNPTGSPTSPGNMTWLYGYDAEGNRTITTDPNGNVTKNAYDPLQRLASITQPAPAPAAATPTINLGYDGQGISRLSKTRET